MAIDYHKLKNWHFPEVEHSYRAQDSILYALGLGLGADPTDRQQLRFVYEEGLQALPTMAVVLGSRGSVTRDPASGIPATLRCFMPSGRIGDNHVLP